MNNTNIDMNNYYKFRDTIRTLYDHDVEYDDLASRILELRDKKRYIESISLAIQDHKIEIELSENSSENKINDTIKSVSNDIKDFLLNNSNEIKNIMIKNGNENDIDCIDEYINSKSYSNPTYCDICQVGNFIIFNL